MLPRSDRSTDGFKHFVNENEPVVCRPDEALDCFLGTKMDALIMGDFVLLRQGGKVTHKAK